MPLFRRRPKRLTAPAVPPRPARPAPAPAAPAVFACETSAQDTTTVATKTFGPTTLVRITTTDGDTRRGLVMHFAPARARALAAAILNAADHADGTERLTSLTMP